MALVRDAAAPPGDGCHDGIGRTGAALARRRIRPCGHRSIGLRPSGYRYAERGRQRSGSRRTRGFCGARRFRRPDRRAVAHAPRGPGTASCDVAQGAVKRSRSVVGELSQQFCRDSGGRRRVPVRRQIPARPRSKMSVLKKLFWLYFLLLIFEGALRKWVLPGFSAPLLLVRDPVAALIIIDAHRTNKWPERWSVVMGVLACALLGLCVWQMILGDNSWIAAVYGLRSYLLPCPVAFIMGENLDADDLRKFGAATLWLMLPLAALEVAQYLAPQGSILNAGAYKGAEQIYYVEEHVRASGTFSFVAGPTFYNAIVASLLFYGLMNKKFARKWLLWAGLFALVLSVPVVGSRTLVAELAGVAVCAGIAATFGVTQFIKVVKVALPLLAVYFLVSLLPVFSSAAESLRARSINAYSSEGGMRRAMVERTSGSIAGALIKADYSSHPIGIGMGRGAAAVSALSTGR